MLTQINTSKSVARFDDDRDKIHRAIREKIAGGFTSLDRRIFNELEKWMIHLLQGQIQEAEEDAERATWQKALGSVYEESGKYDEAEPLYLEALNTRRRVLGDEHPSTLTSINNLANLYYQQGRYDEALSLYLEDLNASRRVLGDEHPDTLISINNLAVFYRNTEKYELAIQMYTEAILSAQRTLGAEHPDTALYQNGLGFTYYKQGRYDLAEPLLVSSLESGRRTLGSSHPDVITRIERLADMLEATGQTDRAQRLRDELSSSSPSP
jgi:tetratricopeptide (TPR) repeat protein